MIGILKSSIIAVIFFPLVFSGKTNIAIQKAFDKKMITAKAICSGGLELNYTITNVLKDSVVIKIPAGWRFNSDDIKTDYQDILLAHDVFVVLKAKETKTFHISGYCCEATKSGPVNGIRYTKGKLADSNLVVLARYLNSQNFDRNSEQYSVWAISNNRETANITSKNDSLAGLLRVVVANIKGEPLPWYTLLKKAFVTTSGNVYDWPIEFKATINYAVSSKSYSYCYLLNEGGQKVSGIFGQWLYSDEVEYKAKFNVSNLKVGLYTLVLECGDGPIFSKVFKI
jgi:hypothetical protein